MEYIAFGILAVAFIAAIVGKDIYNDRKKQRLFEESLRKDYGTQREKKLNLERFARMDRYYKKHPEEGQIDDITWNDLGMDEVFLSMNHTYSASGEEYLYYTLRSAGKNEEELAELESMIQFYVEHEDERVATQLIMAKLGYMGKFSLYDYLDNLDYLGERSNRRAILMDLLFIPLLCMLPFAFSYAILGIVALSIFNITTYFREKSDIEPYIISFQYILKLLDAAEKMDKLSEKEKQQKFDAMLQKLRESKKALQPLRKGSFWVVAGNGSLGGSNPAELLTDYVKMTFHVDLIQFNRMLQFVRKHADVVDQVNTILGRMETAIAIGAWRTDLAKKHGFCIPYLQEGGEVCLKLTEGYHPLIKEPVKNSVTTKDGVLLTGSNASGKSTFLKMVALNAILAQTVHTCTADAYQAPYFRMYSSMSLRDDLQGGDSYYVVEIKALKRILMAAKEAGRPVLCFVDEVLRGTNTVERIAASTQILKSLHGDGVLCFAATHDIELTQLLDKMYDNYHFEEEIVNGDILFQYRLLPGKATTRNAIKLLEIIGYDQEVIQNAQGMAEDFLRTGRWS
ncbi:MAG: hypothetical protein E7295_05205 [Lachnospiraceae bacterium]|jgi:hypothetical protein|nr:hypothetical protein [Lachnospiraceae bacterium]